MSQDASAEPSSTPQNTAAMDIDQNPEERDVTEQEVFDHVVRLLSMTANASLSELGHFPGSGMLLQELRKQNEQFRDITTKLHDDNVTLQRIVDRQKQDIATLQKNNFALANQAEELRRNCIHLDDTLRRTIAERDRLFSYTQVQSQPQPPRWSAEFIPPPIPYNLHQVYARPPMIPVIPGYNMQQGPRLAEDIRGGQIPAGAVVHTPVISSQAAQASPPVAPVIDLTVNEDTSSEERDKKRPRHGEPEESSSVLATPITPNVVDPSQVVQQISHVKEEILPPDVPASVPEQPQSATDVPIRVPEQPQPDPDVPVHIQDQPQPPPQTEDADEDEDEERDADGLVPVSKCVETAYDERDGRMWCKMCEFRNIKTSGTQPLQPMPTNNEQDLVRHLQETHPAGWNTLRNS